MSILCTQTTVPYAEEWISKFAAFARLDWLTVFFKGVTFFGEETFYIGAVVLALHLVKRRTAVQLALLVVGMGLINSWLKGWFQECRPFSVEHLQVVKGFSFPSGHAQVGGAFWGFLMWRAPKAWQKILLFVWILLIALSRPYLGVHFFHDVGIGLVLGLSLSWVFSHWGDKILDYPRLSMFVLAGAAPLCFMNPRESFKILGAFAGLLIGWHEFHRLDPSEESFSWKQRFVSLISSGIALVVFFTSKELSLLNEETWGLIRYFVLCYWISFLSPFLASKVSG